VNIDKAPTIQLEVARFIFKHIIPIAVKIKSKCFVLSTNLLTSKIHVELMWVDFTTLALVTLLFRSFMLR